MSRRQHAHAEDRQPVDLGVAGLSLFAPPAGERADSAPPAGVIPDTASTRAQRRREQVSALHEAGSRRWIDAGKPVALAVIRATGRVTAETFRDAAERVPGALPPSYGEDRTLSYLASMFRELVREGHIEKLRRGDGSVVKEYAQANRNEHVVYVAKGHHA